MAPFDRRPKRALARGRVSRAAGEQRERVLEPTEQRPWVEELRTRGSELHSEWQPVQTPADRCHVPVGLQLATDRPGALDEEHDRVRIGKRLEWILALGGQSERRAARHEQTQAGRSSEELGERCRCIEKVLDVVQQEERVSVEH